MYLHLLFVCLASVCWVSADEKSCNTTEYQAAYEELHKELGLLDNSNATNQVRPLSYDDYTVVLWDLYLSSITDVDENAQTMSTQVILSNAWYKDKVYWEPDDFCGISSISVQKELFWIPDAVFMESIKTEFASESPYVTLNWNGYFVKVDILSLTTVCSMDLYRFPFDTQTCDLTLRSLSLRDKIVLGDWSSVSYQQSLQIPGEWQLLDVISQGNHEETYGHLLFQITIKRKPLLYIFNLIFPVFCFLVLDVASFFINASAGDKLSFKVTLLLSLSVLLQIPTVSVIPLIGIYSCSIFVLIGLSILETIFVNILIVKGKETESAISMETRDVVNGQDGHSTDSFALGGVRDHMDTDTSGNEESTCTSDTGKRASLCWTRAAKIIDVTYNVLYIITVIVLLSVLGKRWFL
ncbi:5-hydroxytryptamine receptor 3A-like [Paramisgurnus dabryanus]|uniref:5-hydroxytryptamine receptor 3A-like n=1 Tax=Paramisgurnus dabryanus TaxID=90735 RepID=UPI0031F4086F